MKSMTTKDLSLLGLLTALVFLGGFIIKIPTFGGFVHLGDCMVLLAAVVLGPKKGALASAVGMAMVDIMSGYMVWAPFTFVIKGIMALIAGYIFIKMSKSNPYRYLAAFTPACIFMIVAYMFSGIIIAMWLSVEPVNFATGFIFAVKDVPGNILQGTAAMILGIPLCNVLLKTKIVTS